MPCRTSYTIQIIFACIFGAAAIVARAADSPGLIPYDSRWEFPHFLGFRPANGAQAEVNPPRFSWAYYPWGVLPSGNSTRIGPTVFRFQVSRSADFENPEIDIETAINFHNALGPLEPGAWHWRVLYNPGKPDETASEVRTFSVAEDTPKWDRSIIDRAPARLAEMPHPRYGPEQRDWAALKRHIESDAVGRKLLENIRQRADWIKRQKWYTQPLEDDRFPKTERNRNTLTQFQRLTNMMLEEAFLNLIGERDTFDEIKPRFMRIAKMPPGGWASPEGHGSTIKHTSIITTDLAIFRDWFYDRLTPEERDTLLKAVEWRLRAQMFENFIWIEKDRIEPGGIGVRAQSHQYQDMMWIVPGAMLIAGESKVADDVLRIGLNYLTGVTGGSGADEGWNEGPGYGAEKGGTMIKTSVFAMLLLPELQLQNNPFYAGLAKWYRHLIPVGIQRLGFGDLPAGDLMRYKGEYPGGGANAWLLSMLTADPVTAARAVKADDMLRIKMFPHPYLPLIVRQRFPMPEPGGAEPTHAAFLEAGWVMESTRPPGSLDDWRSAHGMIFQCRPRGGYSHSYRSDNSFAWYAFGQTLSAGGGSMIKMNPHTARSHAHNVVLVDGQGQEWDSWQPEAPFVARLLAYRRGQGYTYWAGDATYGFQGNEAPDLERWHRHVVFLPQSVVMLDDLAMRPGAPPARFSWLHHVAPRVPLAVDADKGLVSYEIEGVKARVAFGGDPATLEFLDMAGREGYKNPLAGEDYYPELVKHAVRFGKSPGSGNRGYQSDYVDQATEGHVVWATNRQPAQAWRFLTVMSAAPPDAALPQVAFPSENAVRIAPPEGKARTVSFRPDTGDVAIDATQVLRHARRSDPARLFPASEAWDQVTLGGDKWRARWMYPERFDRNDWVVRWMNAGNALVGRRGDALHVSCFAGKDPAERRAMLWLRPELPANSVVRLRGMFPARQGNASHLEVYMNARESGGAPFRLVRTGRASDYAKMTAHRFVFSDGALEIRANPGDRSIERVEGVGTFAPDKEFELALALEGGLVRVYLDGKRVGQARCDILDAGRLGIRTQGSELRLREIEIAEIQTDASESGKAKKAYAPLPLSGMWRVRLTKALEPAPSMSQTHPDPGPSDTARAAMEADFDDSDWQEVAIEGAWEDWGEQWKKDGEAVLRYRFKIPAEWRGRDLELHLGRIDDFDVTYFNGEKVGSVGADYGDAWSVMRVYEAPASIVRFGEINTIAIRVWDHFGAGGFTSEPQDRYVMAR